MPLSRFVPIFLLEEVAFLLYTLLILRSSKFCFEFKKKCDQVQKSGPVPPSLMSLSQAKCIWLNVAVAIGQRYRLSEDIALSMYTFMILKTFGPVPLGFFFSLAFSF